MAARGLKREPAAWSRAPMAPEGVGELSAFTLFMRDELEEQRGTSQM